MQLSMPEVDQFFRIHSALMCFVNNRLGVVPDAGPTPEEYLELDPTDRLLVHEALIGHRELIDEFADANPFDLDDEDLAIVRTWRHLVAGRFFAYRQLQGGMIFLTESEPITAYQVASLSDPFADLLGPTLPRLVETTLLPWDDQIVYDGLMSVTQITFGGGFKRHLNDDYRQIRDRGAIVKRLPPRPAAAPDADRRGESPVRPGLLSRSGPKSKAKLGSRAKSEPKEKAGARAEGPPLPPATGGEKVPAAARAAFDRIVALLDAFCRDHLDDEYAELCRRMAALLARKRPAPILSGKPEGWAAGIVRSVGFANFLGDPSQPRHMRMSDVDRAFGVSEATGSAKGTLIRRLLDVDRLGAEWTLPSRLKDNPMIWLLKVNGLVMDIRDCPREAQAVAFRQGLIPYIPADRGEGRPRR